MAQNPAELFTDIADAIREKDPTAPASIPVSPPQGLAYRIQQMPTPPPSGFSNNLRTYRFDDFLPQDVADAAGLTLLDGRSLHQGVDPQSLFDAFKTDWINQISEIPGTWGRYNAFASQLAMGRYLYVGTHGNSSTGLTTSILKIDTLTGKRTEITGLPARIHSNFQPVERKLYVTGTPTSGNVTFGTIVCVDVIDDTVELLSIGSNNDWRAMWLVPNAPFPDGRWASPDVAWRLFIANHSGGSTNATYLELDHNGRAFRAGGAGTTRYTTNHTSFYVWGHKIIELIHGTLAVIDTSCILPGWWFAPPSANWPEGHNPAIHILFPSFGPNGIYARADNYLYTGGTGAIARIEDAPARWEDSRSWFMSNAPMRETTGLPSRALNVFEYDGPRNKLFVGSTDAATSILRIRHSDGQAFEIEGLPSRGHIGFRRVGDKIYVASNTTTAFANLVVIDMINDAGDTIPMVNSRTYSSLFVNGTFIYALTSTATTMIAIINTATDIASEITGLPSRPHNVPVLAEGRIYFGSSLTTAGNFVPVINAATNTFIESLIAPLARLFNTMLFYNGVIYIFGGWAVGLVGHTTSIAIIAQATLPEMTPMVPVYVRSEG